MVKQTLNSATPKKLSQSEGPAVEIPSDLTMVSLFEQAISKHRDKVAFHCLGVSMRYKELDLYVNRFAAYLKQQGLQPGDKVAIMLPNLLQYPVVLWAVLKLGLVVVNLNPIDKAPSLEHELADSGAKLIVVLENCTAELNQVIGNCPIEKVVMAKATDFHGFVKRHLMNFVIRFIKKAVPAVSFQYDSLRPILLNSKATPLSFPAVDPQDLAFIQYTGGTTGKAKGVALSHHNVASNISQVVAWAHSIFKADDLMVTPLPLYHIFALVVNGCLPLVLGIENLLIPNPRDTTGFIKALKSYRFTAITGVNTLYNELLAHPDIENVDFSQLKLAVGGGMAVQKDIAERWQQQTGCALCQGYGLTEASPVVSANRLDNKSFNGTIGYPMPGTEICIKDSEGQLVPWGEKGELCIRGQQVMQGYWQLKELTNQVIDKAGWLHSGDVAMLDEKGRIAIVDRIKDMVIVSGFNVYPIEIEQVLATMDGVYESAVVGVPEPKTGEALKAFIVKVEGIKISENQVIDYCKSRLAAYKVPHAIEFCDSLPKSAVGKILKKDLVNEDNA